MRANDVERILPKITQTRVRSMAQMDRLRVAIVDDDQAFLEILREVVNACGAAPELFSTGASAKRAIEAQNLDAVLTDYRLPGGIGGDAIVAACRLVGVPVAVISAVASPEVSMRLVQLGANDYLLKPSSVDELLARVQLFLEHAELQRAALNLTKAFSGRGDQKNSAILGATPALKPLLNELPRTAQSGANVLVTGESGTGKELAARAVHELSRRAQGRFVAVDCGAIPEALLENEFFGHKKGAFSDAREDTDGVVQLANGGTLFLDEVAELPLVMQAKLLRFLQTKEYRRLGDPKVHIADVRIVAATHQDLRLAVEAKRFRQDLYYRLNVLQLRLPPLRERAADIPLLATAFLHKYAETFASPALAFTRDAFALLQARSWHGNVRELENIVQRAVALATTPQVTADHLRDLEQESPMGDEPATSTTMKVPASYLKMPYHEARQGILDTFEVEYAKSALARHKGNVSAAARDAELDRKSLIRLMARHSIVARE
jgi:two-component system, NtrC family, response regulator GlrR